MKVWVFYGTTASGDYYGPAVFDYPVTKGEVRAILNEVAPGVEVEIGIWEEQVNSRPPDPVCSRED
jgi:hypothetical protein